MEYNSQSPYFDDYDPRKGYVQVLAIGDRVEQAREFTQIQSINLDFLQRLGNAVLPNGSILEGCNLIIKDNRAIISSGSIFLDGLVRIVYGEDMNVDGDIINVGGIVDITGAGTERIGARIVSRLITEREDPTLLDPAVAAINYGQPGAHRVQQLVEFTVNADNAATLFTIVDGELQNQKSEVDTTSAITDTLARRTYDENGNYKIYGLTLRPLETENLALNISDGKAYIQGYEVLKSTMSKLKLSAIEETQTVVAEPKYFLGAGDDHLYKLNYYPCKNIHSIIAQVRVIDEQVSRTYPSGGRDTLEHDQIVRILSVYSASGNQGTLYTEGRDFALSDDDIDWSINLQGSIEPAIGSSYYVSYLYNKVLIEGTDYDIVNQDGEQFIRIKPNVNDIYPSYMNITYDVYLARRDLILLSKDGAYDTKQSAADRQSMLITPYNMDPAYLELGFVDIVPYLDPDNAFRLTYRLSATNYKTERLTQAQLYVLSKRLDDLEYNQAIEDLDREAEEGEAASSLKGIYTDGFIGMTKCDLHYNRGGVKFNACIDYDLAELTIPAETVANELTIDSSNVGRIGRVISAPFTSIMSMKQPYATDKMLVNPYAEFNPLSIVELNPAVDNWIETETVRVNNQQEKTSYQTSYATYSHGWWSTSATHNLRNYLRSETSTKTTYTGTTTSTAVSNSVKDTIIEYMRQIEVTVNGSNFTKGQDNIECYFNEELVALTPLGGTQAGTNQGTVRADASGKFKAKFKIPAKTPCGTVLVQLRGATSRGSAEFTAEGTLKTTTVTTTITKTKNYKVLVETHNLYGSDPLAQSFRYDRDTILTGVGLYFGAKDVNKAVVVQVRNMVNGYPGDIVYAAVTVNPNDVVTSSDSSRETVVNFNQPVYCNAGEFYCFTILSDSNAYEMFYCDLGGTDILTKEVVTSNPNNGLMFSSSNANTWTAHQASDLKFNLYEAKYTGTGSILFNQVSVADMNKLVLAAEYIDYKNAGIVWSYRYKTNASADWSTWYPLDTYILRSLDEVSSVVQLKAELHTAFNTSPFIAGDCINLISFIDGKAATYVSREIYLSEDYTKLKIACQFYAPVDAAACGFKVYYMDDGKTWTQLTSEPEVSKIDDEFNEYVWELGSIAHTRSKSYRVRIDLWTNNVFYRPRARKLRSILKY